MAKPQIKIDQSGKPAGVAGLARSDITVGTSVVLTAVGTGYTAYRWTLIDAPPSADLTALSTATISSSTSAVAGITPDHPHTYHIQLEVDSGAGIGNDPDNDVVTITFAAGQAAESNDPMLMPLRRPAFREMAVHNAPTTLYPSGNPKGWKDAEDRLFRVVDYLRSTKATASNDGLMSKEYAEKLDGIAANAAALTSSAPAKVTRATAVVGVGTTAARSDHKHDIDEAGSSTLGVVQMTGDLSGTGSAPTVARINGASVPAAGALTTGYVLMVSGASALSYGAIANANISTTAAIAVTKLATGGANQILQSNGTVNSWGAMSDAIHGNLSGGTLHALASNTAAGFAPQLSGSGPAFLGTANGVTMAWQTALDVALIGPGSTPDRALTTNGTTASWTQITNNMLAGNITWGKLTGYPTITTTAPLTIAGGASADLSTNRTLAVSNATTGAVGVIQLAGDLGGTGAAPSVLKINGASVPIAGSLVTGAVLQVSGPSALSYGLIGNSNIATNAAVTVSKLAAGTSNQLLITSGTTVAWSAMSDAVHGALGGGSLHALATNSIAGFVTNLPGSGMTALLGTTNGSSQAWISKIGNVFILGGSTPDRVLSTDGTNANWTQVTNAMLVGGITWGKLTGYPAVTAVSPLRVNNADMDTLEGNLTLSVNAVSNLTSGVVPTITGGGALAVLGTTNGTTSAWITSLNASILVDQSITGSKISPGSNNTVLTTAAGSASWQFMNDTLHGGLGGGGLHSVVAANVAGFAPGIFGSNVVLRSVNGTLATWGTVTSAMIASVDWSVVQNRPTTLSGYGITDGISGSGTINTVAKFTGARAVGNSQITDDGTAVAIGGVLNVIGNGSVGIGILNGPGIFAVAGNSQFRGMIDLFTQSGDTAGTTGIRANPNGYSVINPNGSRFVMPVTSTEATSGARNILDIERTDTNAQMFRLQSNGSAWFAGSVALWPSTPNFALDTTNLQMCNAQSGGLIATESGDSGSYNVSPDPYYHSSSRKCRWYKSTGSFSLTGSTQTEALSFSTTIHGQSPPVQVNGETIVGTFLIGSLGNGNRTGGCAQLFLFTCSIDSAGNINAFNISQASTNGHLDLLPGGTNPLTITASTFGGTFIISVRAASAGSTDVTRCLFEIKYGWGAAT